MRNSLTGPLSIINFIELFLSVVIGGLLGNFEFLEGKENYPKVQVINALAYGYLIINIIVVLSNILKEEIPKNVRLIIAGSACLMFIACGALILMQFNTFKNQKLELTKKKLELEKELESEINFRLKIEFQLDEKHQLEIEPQIEEKLKQIKIVSNDLISVKGICGRSLPAAIFSIALAALYLVDISLCF